MPRAHWKTLADYNKANTPVSHDPASANWWQHKPAYITSLLKGWYGDKGTRANGFGYDFLPKADAGQDYSYMYIFDRMYKGQVKGGFIWGTNPAQSVPNSTKVRKAMENLDWACFAEVHHTESTDFWRRPGVDPSSVKTECFLLPSANRAEKDGSITNSGRWQLWHYQATKPQGECLSLGDMCVKITNTVRDLYKKEGGTYPEPLINLDFPKVYDPERLAQKCNGWFTKDTTIKGKTLQKRPAGPKLCGAQGRRLHRLLELALRRWIYRRETGAKGQQIQTPGSVPDPGTGQDRALPQLLMVLACKPQNPLQPGLRGCERSALGTGQGGHPLGRRQVDRGCA